MRSLPIAALLLLSGCCLLGGPGPGRGCKPWRMTQDRERECQAMPFHIWREGECRRVR